MHTLKYWVWRLTRLMLDHQLKLLQIEPGHIALRTGEFEVCREAPTCLDDIRRNVAGAVADIASHLDAIRDGVLAGKQCRR